MEKWTISGCRKAPFRVRLNLRTLRYSLKRPKEAFDPWASKGGDGRNISTKVHQTSIDVSFLAWGGTAAGTGVSTQHTAGCAVTPDAKRQRKKTSKERKTIKNSVSSLLFDVFSVLGSIPSDRSPVMSEGYPNLHPPSPDPATTVGYLCQSLTASCKRRQCKASKKGNLPHAVQYLKGASFMTTEHRIGNDTFLEYLIWPFNFIGLSLQMESDSFRALPHTHTHHEDSIIFRNLGPYPLLLSWAKSYRSLIG